MVKMDPLAHGHGPPARRVPALALTLSILYAALISTPSQAFATRPAVSRTTKSKLRSAEDGSLEADGLYFDIAIQTPAEEVPLGRLTFRLTPASHPGHLPLHASNLASLASGQRRAVDPKATYEGCTFQHSPATVEDGSFRYRWGHVCEGNGRNGIRTTSASGAQTGWDEPFSDPERAKECAHKCFGGAYYGRRYEEIESIIANADDGERAVVVLTVPIHGPGAGTSKFSIVRVGESPQEWGQRLLLNSAVMGYLDCGADGSFGGDPEGYEGGAPTALDVLRAMARQRVGPPKIVGCGVTDSARVVMKAN